MVRKTRSCVMSKIETVLGSLVIRSCELGRNHEGRHWDSRGAFDVDA